MNRRRMGWFSAYIAVIVAANLAIKLVGFVPVAPGVLAPAGVFFAGLSFTLRDFLQEYGGRFSTVVAIFFGAAISSLLTPQFAVASCLAFLASEFLDFAIYTPLRTKNWFAAVIFSNLAGDVLDSVIFLWVAFGSLQFLLGQIIGKWETIVVSMIAITIYKRHVGAPFTTPPVGEAA